MAPEVQDVGQKLKWQSFCNELYIDQQFTWGQIFTYQPNMVDQSKMADEYLICYRNFVQPDANG
jgi:hypothetical protein